MECRIAKPIAALIYSIILSGCASLNHTYLHDPALAEAAMLAEQSFNDANTRDLWQTLSANAQRSHSVEQAALAKSAEQRFEGKLQNLEKLTWLDLQLCGRGSCWTIDKAANFGVDVASLGVGLLSDQPTEEKIVYLKSTVEQLSVDIQSLRTRTIEHLPVIETASLEISSSIGLAISQAEEKISELDRKLEQVKQNNLNQVRADIDNLLTPLLDPFPQQRQQILSTVNNALGEITTQLKNVGNLRALPQLAVNQILKAADDALPDAINEDRALKKKVIKKIKSELLDKLNKKLEVSVANSGIKSVLDELGTATVEAEKELDDIEILITTLLGEPTPLSKRFAAVNDLLRKSSHLDLVKLATIEEMLGGGAIEELNRLGDDINLGDAIKQLKDRELNQDFSRAFSETAGKSLCEKSPCKIRDLVNYLSTDESELQAIRTTLRDDFRNAAATTFQHELRTLQREVALMRELIAVVKELHNVQTSFGKRVGGHIKKYKIQDLSITLFSNLDCLAGTANNTNDPACTGDTKSARDAIQNALSLLAAYFSMEGELRAQEIALWLDVARMKHQRSIEASQLAAIAYEQFISSGLQGLSAFTRGGITTEQIASILRLLSTGLLVNIANQ